MLVDCSVSLTTEAVPRCGWAADSAWIGSMACDTPEEELPSSRFRKAKVYVDCNRLARGRSRRLLVCMAPRWFDYGCGP